jgi:hypothetical protein
MNRLIVTIMFLALIIIPSGLADIESYGIVRHRINHQNETNAILEVTQYVYNQRDGNFIYKDDIAISYTIPNIGTANTAIQVANSSLDPFDATIDKIELVCELTYGLTGIGGTGLFAGFTTADFGNATSITVLDKTYDVYNTAGITGTLDETTTFSIIDEAILKCTMRTYYQNLAGIPERLDTIRPANFVLILPTYDTEICPEYKELDGNYKKVTEIFTALIELWMSIIVIAYWIFKIIIYLTVLAFAIYAVVFMYMMIKAVAGKL